MGVAATWARAASERRRRVPAVSGGRREGRKESARGLAGWAALRAESKKGRGGVLGLGHCWAAGVKGSQGAGCGRANQAFEAFGPDLGRFSAFFSNFFSVLFFQSLFQK